MKRLREFNRTLKLLITKVLKIKQKKFFINITIREIKQLPNNFVNIKIAQFQ